MSGNPIRFGTSGWRAIIADEFTFENVRRAVAAIAGHVLAQNKKPTLIIGHDTRFFSEEFSHTATGVLRERGVRVLLCEYPTPTPAIAYEILRRKADGAINFTASHNPAEYHGLKFSGPDGGPALPEVTHDIEARVEKIPLVAEPGEEHTKPDERINPREKYFARLAELVKFDAIRKADRKWVCDPLWGTGAGYTARLLANHGVKATAIRTDRDVLFGGQGCDVSEANLAPLSKAVREYGAQAGLATDGDADRFGIIDADGSFVQPNHILALLFDYLSETRGWKLGTARSVASTHLLDAVARHFGVPVYQTPVGFKYVGELIKQDKITLGGEESAGLSIRGHVPEKDGILAGMLVAEMISVRGAPIGEQLRALFRKVGAEFWPLRANLHLTEEVKTRTLERLKADPHEFLGRRVGKIDRTDGSKFIFADGSWVLMRMSGTEPLLRLYTEAASLAASQKLSDEARQWVFA